MFFNVRYTFCSLPSLQQTTLFLLSLLSLCFVGFRGTFDAKGLINSGNQCYLNSTIQSMISSKYFILYLCSVNSIIKDHKEMNLASKMPLTKGFIDFIRIPLLSLVSLLVAHKKHKPMSPMTNNLIVSKFYMKCPFFNDMAQHVYSLHSIATI